MSIRQIDRTIGLALIACIVVSAAVSLVGSAPDARADAATGLAAYEKGDYSRAAVEWQSAADHGDADAELGIGSLYELGQGDLPQDYDRANYWYRKAAAQGRTEAEYRLALIYAAGSKNFRPDFVEAWKWVVLAAESKGVWGSVATDLKIQLDGVLRPDEKKSGEKKADAWKQELSGLSVVSSAAKPARTGCPGWPFPTLPCTEQPPAWPTTSSGPPNSGSKEPLEQLNTALTKINCAWLRTQTSPQGTPMISGTVPDSEQRAQLLLVAGRFFPNRTPNVSVDIVPPPLCHSLAKLNAMRLIGLVVDHGLRLHLANGLTQLRENDPIKVEVQGPAFAVNLRIDYFSLDDRVLHLWPNNQDVKVALAAGETRLFGDAANGKTWNAGGAPFGTELITAIATPDPLELGGSRPETEAASDYLRDVERALSRISPLPDTPNLLSSLLVKTHG